MLDKLSALHNQDDSEDDDDDRSLYLDYPDDFKLIREAEKRKEITQFNDNLCNFTPLLYQFTAPGYPRPTIGILSMFQTLLSMTLPSIQYQKRIEITRIKFREEKKL